MRETTESLSLYGSFINGVTGEVSEITATHQMSHKNYSIKRFNMRMWIEAYSWLMEKGCNSSKDISIFNHIISELDKENEFRGNQKMIAEELDTSTRNITKMINKLISLGFFIRKERGVYLANPFVLVSKKVKSNAEIEELQKSWKSLYGIPTYEKMNNGSLI
jgi:DNA-binding MarR family transcriptional regulator